MRGRTWTWEQDYFYAEGALVGGETQQWAYGGSAQYGGPRHYHLDHLGSVRVVTEPGGARADSISEYEYYPFGTTMTKTYQEPLNWGDLRTDPMRFAGHARDFLGLNVENTEYLDYMHARYYDPNLGRFLSVDPVIAPYAARTPQAWNRYTYVLNNPMRFTDPTGLVADCKPETVKGADGKETTRLRCSEGESATVTRKAPPPSLFSFNFPYLSFALQRRAEKAREGQPNKSTFTSSQCQSLFKVVEREAREGTQRAAARSSNTWGDRTIGQFNVDFNTRGNPTLSNGSMIDVDWFTDISSYTGNMPSAAPAAYVFGKSFWHAVGGTQGWPFQDPGEVTAVSYASRGASYNEIYNQACP